MQLYVVKIVVSSPASKRPKTPAMKTEKKG